jgi:hypothetical protein
MPHTVSFDVVPILPPWAIAAVAAALAALVAHGAFLLVRKKLPGRWVTILALLRLAISGVFVLCLLQPVVSFSRSEERRPDALVLIDTSRSMSRESAARPGVPRLREVLDTLRTSGVAADLGKRHDLRWFAFDRNAYPIEPQDLEGLGADGDATDFATSLETAFDHQRQSDPAAVAASRALLVSDGNDLGADDVVDVARRLGLRLDTLAPTTAGTGAGVETIAIAGVQTPRRVLLGSNAEVTVTFRGGRPHTRPVPVTLFQGDRVLATHELVLAAGQPEQQIRLSFKPEELGLARYELRVGDADAKADGGDQARYAFSVQVVGDQNEVLVLEDSWRWGFKFLRRVLEDDPSFTMTAFLPRGGASMQFGEPGRRVNLGAFPQTRAELEWFDIIVLGDVNPTRWPRGLGQGIEQLVTEEGKSLIVIAGPNLVHWLESAELAALLPVEVVPQSGRPIEGPVAVRVTREGEATPFFSLAPVTDGSPLPSMNQVYPPLRKKPAATILLEAAGLANAYGPLIIAAEHTVGRGRVLFLGSDTLWRWQMQGPQDESGLTPHMLFWQQALRAMAPPRLGGSGAALSVQPQRTRYEAGRLVTLEAQATADRPLPRPALTSTVTMPDGRQVPLAFSATGVRPGGYAAEFEAGAPGPYRIAATLTSEGKPQAEVLTVIDVERTRTEDLATTVDVTRLARIAAATGGSMIDPADRATWPGDQAADVRTVEVPRSIDLWSNYALVLVLCGLLGIDWLLRMLRGYT